MVAGPDCRDCEPTRGRGQVRSIGHFHGSIRCQIVIKYIIFRSSADILVADSLMDLTPRQEEQFFQSPVAEKTSAAAADTSALLPIVHAQRERFRQRNEELEDAQARHLQQISLLQGETEGLKTDNVKLYEKIRFLQGFGGAPRQIQSSSSSAVVEVESRYRNTYEQKLHPFSTFSNQG